MTDPSEDIRKQILAEINAAPGSREYLEHKHGQVWDTSELQRFTHRLHARIIRIEGEHLGISSCGRSLLPCVPIRWTFASGSRPRSIITTARSAGSPESSASAPPLSSACSSIAAPPA